MLIPERIAIGLTDRLGFTVRNFLVWFAPNKMPESVRDRFSNRWEPVLMATKGDEYWFDLDAVRVPHETRPGESNGRKKGSAADTTLDGTVTPEAEAEAQKWEGIGMRGPPSFARKRHKGYFTDDGEPLVDFGKGKNPGDVLIVNTQQHGFAHFAVYPDALADIFVAAACPGEICRKCGRARSRVTETEYDVRSDRPKGLEPKLAANVDNKFKNMKFTGSAIHRTVGWTECGCGSGWVPGVALDPFAGSGTTALSALKAGKSSISIEINGAYIEDILKPRLGFGSHPVDETNGIAWMEERA
ncbi:MAG: site-specific DNA-methyltransferase [Thaumarchaeota archaeon]|nr:site-specific DNA-methyltransferase [Nitrososphaerota archaeon]